MRPTDPHHDPTTATTGPETATATDTAEASADDRAAAAAARRTATALAHLRELHRPAPRLAAPSAKPRARARRRGAIVASGLALATALTLAPAGPAGATTVGDEAAIRAAFADPNETLVTLTTHIDLTDCVAGDLERTSATPLTIEANGFRLRQTCAGERILTLDGGGGVTVDHLQLTGGDAVGSGGGAIASDGPVIIRGGSELSGNTASNGGAVDAHGPGATITVLDSLIAVNQSTANGGALFSDAPIELRDSTFADNDSGSHGGVATASTIVVSGSTFQGNQADAGGVFQAGSSVTIDSSSFTGNQARVTDGGVIFLVDADATVTGSTFHLNDAAGNGGAIAASEGGDGSTITLAGSTFEDNTAIEGGAVYGVGVATVSSTRMESNESTALSGGAIFMDGSLTVDQGSVLTRNASDQNGGAVAGGPSITISASEVRRNAATSVGGGIAGYADVTVVDGSTVTGNAATQGGGIYADGLVTVADSTVSGNAATSDEGGGIRTGGGASIARSTFAENAAAASGGAVFAFDVPIAIEASTFTANTAGAQGGAISSAQTTTVANSTITGNEAGLIGGGIGSEGDVRLVHVTLAANTAPSGTDLAMVTPGSILAPTATVLASSTADGCRLVGVAVTSGGFNRSADDTCGLADPTDGTNAADPALGELADNGGPTATRLPLADSPLVDAIPAAACTPEVPLDQRSVARPAGSGCDIGAVEVAAAPGGTGDPGDGPTVDPADPAEVLGLVSDAVGTAPAGTLPLTGSAHLWVLGAAGAALIGSGRLLLTFAKRRRLH